MIPEFGQRAAAPGWSASQASRIGAAGRLTTASRSDSRSSAPRSTSTPPSLPSPPCTPAPSCSATSVVTRALAVAVVASTGMSGRQGLEQGADAAVVGPEVVSPVGDAVRLVDDDQAGRLGQVRQHVVAEPGVVEPLRADQQDVDRAVPDLGVDLLPVVQVGRVDRARVDARPRRRLDLVAHQRQQRRHDHGGPGPGRAQQRGRDEVDRRLAPPGPLHHQRAPLLGDEGADRRPLVVAQPRVLACQRPQVLLGRFPQFLIVGHVPMVSGNAALRSIVRHD